MGKKKFIDKKKSATFQLYARDTSDPNYSNEPGSDRVFVRVDDNPYSIDAFGGAPSVDEDPNSVFADALEDVDDEDNDGDAKESVGRGYGEGVGLGVSKVPLSEELRREILELGFPDDGYNYLMHMREIKNTGGGSAYYENPLAKFEKLPLDVKIYNASKVRISEVKEHADEKTLYKVASQTYSIKVPKVIDPEVAALLDDDDDLSRFGSDVEDLEEDFMVRANPTEEGDDVSINEELGIVQGIEVPKKELSRTDMCKLHENVTNHLLKSENDCHDEKPRARRLLDEQFDMLESQEYGSDSDDYYNGSIVDEDEALAGKLYHALKDRGIDDLELDGNYRAPTDILQSSEISHDTEIKETAAQVIRRTKEYGINYEMEDDQGNDLVVVEESSDESETWDCETIITTYSNLDNHPAKIEAPEKARRKKLSETVSEALNANTHMISLGGKQKLPLNFLPNSKKVGSVKAKVMDGLNTEKPKRKQLGQETKEEKKERKTAVKEEKREARRVKKEIKGLYRSEAHRAQGVAATSGPSSIHLM